MPFSVAPAALVSPFTTKYLVALSDPDGPWHPVAVYLIFFCHIGWLALTR
jgi:hypothetical protein